MVHTATMKMLYDEGKLVVSCPDCGYRFEVVGATGERRVFNYGDPTASHVGGMAIVPEVVQEPAPRAH